MGNVTYMEYHKQSMEAKDVDPSVVCLNYIADRFELNLSQRYWIAFLYGTNYCAATTFMIYNEFPDFEMVNVDRLERWWEKNKSNLIFQSDRLRVKTQNQFIPCFKSYKSLVKGNQQRYFLQAKNWKQCYELITGIYYFGRFSTFNYLDVLNGITDVVYSPTYLDMREAESCRNGLCYAIGEYGWVDQKLTKSRAQKLHSEFLNLLKTQKGNIYQIETTLCAYKKYRRGKRYVGYYIERMRVEIERMQKMNPNGVAWETLWQFRDETFDKKYLNEHK